MLQNLIQDLQSTLKNYSKGLENKNLLVEIPWTMVDGDLNLQRLIFKKDYSLYIVKEGEIQESKWEYLPAMNSLVVEIGGKKILLNSVFSDGKALILKKDGVSLEFLSFANQNEIPDLNLVKYLSEFNQINIQNSLNTSKIQGDPKEVQQGFREALIAILVLIIFMVIYYFL